MKSYKNDRDLRQKFGLSLLMTFRNMLKGTENYERIFINISNPENIVIMGVNKNGERKSKSYNAGDFSSTDSVTELIEQIEVPKSTYRASRTERLLNDIGVIKSYLGVKKFENGVAYPFTEIKEFLDHTGQKSYHQEGVNEPYRGITTIKDMENKPLRFAIVKDGKWLCIDGGELSGKRPSYG